MLLKRVVLLLKRVLLQWISEDSGTANQWISEDSGTANHLCSFGNEVMVVDATLDDIIFLLDFFLLCNLSLLHHCKHFQVIASGELHFTYSFVVDPIW